MRSILAAVVRSPMKSRRRFLNDLGLIAALTAGATALRYAFNPGLGTRAPFLFHVLTVAIGAQIAGLAPGLISTGMSLLLIRYFFAPPYHSLGRPADPQFGVALLLFAVVGIALSIFGEWRKRTADE